MYNTKENDTVCLQCSAGREGGREQASGRASCRSFGRGSFSPEPNRIGSDSTPLAFWKQRTSIKTNKGKSRPTLSLSLSVPLHDGDGLPRVHVCDQGHWHCQVAHGRGVHCQQGDCHAEEENGAARPAAQDHEGADSQAAVCGNAGSRCIVWPHPRSQDDAIQQPAAQKGTRDARCVLLFRGGEGDGGANRVDLYAYHAPC